MSTTSTERRLVTLVLVLFALFVLLPLLFMGGGMMGYVGFGPMMGAQGGMWGDAGTAPGWLVLVGALLQLLVVAVLVGAVYLGYRLVTGEPTDDALAELRLAYARGDLDDEEYERRRGVLEREGSE